MCMSLDAYYGLTRQELITRFAQDGVTAHQARLVFQALYRHGVLDPAQMPDVSASGRALLSRLEPPRSMNVLDVLRAQDGTVKLRMASLETGPGRPETPAVEAVLVPTPGRMTLCISCQAGCAAACAFCHTGTMGLRRNLEAWEMVEQLRLARPYAPRPITNVVFMGMGEPLHNVANVLQACRILNDATGAGISQRRLVVSTAGVGDRLRSFWAEDVAALALSLHATTDEVRDRIIPMNRTWNLAALRTTLLEIPWRRRESLTVAYLLLDGINDSRDDAYRLSQWCRDLPAKVNLLEFNPFPGSTFRRTPPDRLAAFRQWLHDQGVFNTHRRSRGDQVMAACGQLATPGVNRRKSPR